MALYAPIRDAFNDFNNMLIDSQQWDERHAARQHAQDMKQMQLVNGLEQQEFSNRMATAEFGLRKAGQDRAAETAKFNREMSNKDYAMRKETQKENLESSRLNRQISQTNLDRTAKQEINRTRVMDQALAEAEVDPAEVISEEIGAVRTAIAGIDKQIANINPQNSRTPAGLAALKVKRNKLKGAEKRAESRATPAGLMKSYLEKADNLRTLGLELSRDGNDKQATYVAGLADDYDARVKNYMDDLAKTAKGGKSTLAQENASFKFGQDQLRKDMTPSNSLLPNFPDQTAAVVYAEKIYTRLANMKGTPKTHAAAAQLKQIVADRHRKIHNRLLEDREVAIESDAGLARFEQHSIDTVGYVVTKPYAKQIYRITAGN